MKEEQDRLDKIGEEMKKGVSPTITPGGEVYENENDHGRDGAHGDRHGRHNPPHRSWSWKGNYNA